jgi:uncharacterized protein (TIGR02598 family)
MNMRRRLPRRRRGDTLMEVLVASLIVGVCVSALVSLWSLSYMLTRDTDDQDVAYTLARQALEAVKQTGFYNTAEAPSSAPVTHYFDANQTNLDNQSSSARYKVRTTVISDKTVNGSNPVQPQDDALRTVTVTVTLVSGGTALYQTSTYLARAGI